MNNEFKSKRIIVLGCPGSGKSTFSKELHKLTTLPLVHLDNIWWKEDHTNISCDEFDRKINLILQGKEWIIDGDYSRTYEKRIKACETLFFLDYSEKQCMEGIIERVGKDRTDIPWTENALDPELVTLVKEYKTKNRLELYELFKKYNQKQILIFKSRAQADEWIIQQNNVDR